MINQLGSKESHAQTMAKPLQVESASHSSNSASRNHYRQQKVVLEYLKAIRKFRERSPIPDIEMYPFQYLHTDVRQLLADQIKENITNSQQAYVSTYEAAFLCQRLYEDNFNDWNQWKVLTKVYGPFNYSGVALANIKRRALIIVHKGNLRSLVPSIDDLTTLVRNAYLEQIIYAITFTFHIQYYKNEIELNVADKQRFILWIVGHSIGGYLAQISSFALKFFYFEPKTNKLIVNTNFEAVETARVISFDSPGAKESIIRLQEKMFGVSSLKDLDYLEIVNYFAAPNLFNMSGGHVGTCYRLFFAVDKEMQSPGNTDTHEIEKFVEHLGKRSTKSYLVLSWPNLLNTSLNYNVIILQLFFYRVRADILELKLGTQLYKVDQMRKSKSKSVSFS